MDLSFLLWNSFLFSLPLLSSSAHSRYALPKTFSTFTPVTMRYNNQFSSIFIVPTYFIVLIISIHIRRRIVPININTHREGERRKHNMLCCSHILSVFFFHITKWNPFIIVWAKCFRADFFCRVFIVVVVRLAEVISRKETKRNPNIEPLKRVIKVTHRQCEIKYVVCVGVYV